jgi:quinol monooxygenase YgiN
MLALTIDFTVTPDNRKELLQTIYSLTEKSKSESGRISRHLYRDAEETDRFILKEEWRKEKDLRRYLKGDLFGVLIGALNLLGESRQLKLERISETLDESAVIGMRRTLPEGLNAL